MVVNYNFVFFSNNEVIQKKNLVKDQTHLLVALTEMQSHCTLVNTTNKNDNQKKKKTWVKYMALNYSFKDYIIQCKNNDSLL